ncbi:MAG: 3-phosphoshikimate 1-carboxyvinyltransferase [Rhodospirillales bacterium]|nr:3-phosphoshikimate 1-carboxyvinyltransferase [Rhodospirillales bacterium]
MRYPVPLKSSRSGPLSGATRIPGDKSISHRALILGGLGIGETIIHGLLEGEDVLNTAHAMKAFGARIHRSDDGLWHAYGVGTGNLREPAEILDMGNSGTSTRLLIGLAAGHPITAFFTGDSSLLKRPMSRVMTPLGEMGAQFMARDGGRLPLGVRGSEKAAPVSYRLPVPSAQVKSAILLAGLNAQGTTTVIEPVPTRDHTENMLRHFGLDVVIEDLSGGARAVHIEGPKCFEGCAVDVPSDPSSAAFPVVAAILVEGSEIRLPGLCVNPARIGVYETLREMGADIRFEHERVSSGERVADLVVRSGGGLRGMDVPPDRVPSMIDEIPVLAVAAACANGITRLTGLAELRVKESDRLAAVASGLSACGVRVEAGQESLTIHGTGGSVPGGAHIETNLDHRIAMAFLVLGMVADSPVTVDDSRPIATSFPGFVDLMNDLGAQIEPVDGAILLARD